MTKYYYLVRHGEAYSPEEDPQRGLNEQGRTDIERVAHMLRAKGITLDAIYHSEKLRSQQTAEIIAKKLDLSDKMSCIPYLDPDSNINQLSSFFESLDENALLVGHMPNLEILTSYILSSSAEEFDFSFSPGSIVCLKHDSEGYHLEWIISPSEGSSFI